jgi:hypothetical protein
VNIYTSERTPYTYLIGWSKLNTYYYGLRFAVGCHPTELWKTYFTSSAHVADFVAQHGDPDVLEIRKTFTVVPTAQLWEHRVLKRIKAVQRKDFLNRTDNKSIAPQYGDDNPSKRPEVQKKISDGLLLWYETNDNPNLGTKWTEEEKCEWGAARKGENNPFYGHKHTEKNKQGYSERQQGENNSFYGKTHKQSTKAHWSQIRSGVLKPRVSCIFCRTEVAINLFTRWHGDNCKTLNTNK